MQKNAVIFTVCSANYLTKAFAMCSSALDCSPGLDVVIVVVDTKRPVRIEDGRINIKWIEDLGFPSFLHCAFKYSIIELNTAVKPFVAQQLLLDYMKVVYLDPDVCVFSSLQCVLDELDTANVIFSPHANSPYKGSGRPEDVDLLRFGSFNLGFFAVKSSRPTYELLAWWHERCFQSCFYEPHIGLAVDQKWVDLAPAFFDGVCIYRHPGINVAFWNLHERSISCMNGKWVINGEDLLVFVHFSSFAEADRTIVADKQTRYPPGSRPDFSEVSDIYRERLAVGRTKVHAGTSYGFAAFDNGRAISPSLRRIYAALYETRFAKVGNPFLTAEAVYVFGKREGLVPDVSVRVGHENFKAAVAYGRSRVWLARFFRMALRILGPNRYFSLMRYLAYYSSILNQSDMFKH